jgi:hypothetical protein
MNRPNINLIWLSSTEPGEPRSGKTISYVFSGSSAAKLIAPRQRISGQRAGDNE